jgi:hypothetical protein
MLGGIALEPSIERPGRQAVPDVLSEADLPQVEPLQARHAGRISHGLIASPGRTREGAGHPRLEQHQIATARVDQQPNLLSCYDHLHRQKRPHQLEWGD